MITPTQELHARAASFADRDFSPARDLPTNLRQLRSSWSYMQGRHTGLAGYTSFYGSIGAHPEQADILARAALKMNYLQTPPTQH